jgi:hypothetical protein
MRFVVRNRHYIDNYLKYNMDPLISTEYTASTMLNTSYRAGGMHTGAVYRPALTTSTRGTELNMFSRGRGRCILETFPEISCKTCRLFYRMRQHAIQPLQADSQTAVAILWKPRCYFTHRHTQKKNIAVNWCLRPRY